MPLSPAARKLVQAGATAVACLLALGATAASSRAQAGHMLVIPASDGYGFDDCLAGNQACGHIIADAWCEAHGMASALSFGRSEDITASIGPAGGAKDGKDGKDGKGETIAAGAFIVNCKE